MNRTATPTATTPSTTLLIERNDCCDYGHWRVVRSVQHRGILFAEGREHEGVPVEHRTVVARTMTKLGARWKRRRLRR